MSEALELAARWKDVYSDESHGMAGKNLGILARALLACTPSETETTAQTENEALRIVLDLCMEAIPECQAYGDLPGWIAAREADREDAKRWRFWLKSEAHDAAIDAALAAEKKEGA